MAKLTIDRETCKGCGLCADVCPRHLLALSKEINSKGYSAGLGQPNPCKDIIVRYKELGGDIITIGSDAHTPQSMCFEFERVEALLLECGFRQYAVFSERHPEFYPLG